MAHQGRASWVFGTRIEQGFQASGRAVEKKRLDGGILSEHTIQITWFAGRCRALVAGS